MQRTLTLRRAKILAALATAPGGAATMRQLEAVTGLTLLCRDLLPKLYDLGWIQKTGRRAGKGAYTLVYTYSLSPTGRQIIS